MLAIVGHWTSYEFKVETALLAMKEITGAHKGEFIAPVLHGVAKEFGIDDKLGYFMADNATNNDKALRFLDRAIRNEGKIGFDVEELSWAYIESGSQSPSFRQQCGSIGDGNGGLRR